MIASAVMVVGTDTDVGKTFVAVRLVRALVRRGVDVGVMKPFESGIDAPSGAEVPLGPDAARLLRAAGHPKDETNVVSPFRFREALAPAIAADRAGVVIDVRRVEKAFRELLERHSRVVIEGAGGIYSPLGPRGLNAVNIARRLGIGVVLVAANRLGTLSHILLARETLRLKRVRLRAVVLAQPTRTPRVVRETNSEALPDAIRADSRVGETLVRTLGW